MAGNVSVTREYNRIFTAALDELQQNVLFDNVTSRRTYLFRLRDMGAIVMSSGGPNISFMIYKELLTAQGYTDLGVLDIERGDPVTRTFYGWRQIAAPIHISRLDFIRTANNVTSLLQIFIENAILSLSEGLSGSTVGVFSTGGDGDTTVITGLPSLISSTPTIGTIGNVARSNTFWQNQTANVSGDFSANGYTQMTSLYTLCSRGNENVDTIVLTRSAFNNFLNNATRTFRLNFPLDQKAGDEGLIEMGFPHAMFFGAVVIFDDSVPANQGFFLNLRKKYTHLVVEENSSFAIKGLISPADRDAVTGHALWAGNQVVTNMARQGNLLNADTD